MRETIVAGVFTILGAVLAFLLTEGKNWLWGKRQKRQEREAVRALIGFEAENNLMLLGELRDKYGLPAEQRRNGAEILAMARKLSEAALPAWSHRAWESQLARVPDAFEPDEIQSIGLFHARLDQIVHIHDALRQLAALNEQAKQAPRSGSFGLSAPFFNGAPALWNQYEATMDTLLAAAIPFKDPAKHK